MSNEPNFAGAHGPVSTVDPVAQPQSPPPALSSLSLIVFLVSCVVVAAMTFAAWQVSKHADPSAPVRRLWPFFVVGVGVLLIVALIAIVRLHAFIALVLAGIAAGLMTLPKPVITPTGPAVPDSHWLLAIRGTVTEFGITASKVGVLVALASLIGVFLLQSGSADKIVRRFLGVFGPRRAGVALLLASYVISIPIFFDTLFMLLVPIAQALWLRTKQNYMLFVMAICCAGVITHSMAIPHPGPIAIVENLNAGGQVIEMGVAVMMGLFSGLFPLAVGWIFCLFINRKITVTPPEAALTPETVAALDRPESELPSFFSAILPIILPVVLISAGSIFKATLKPDYTKEHPAAGVPLGWTQFLGEAHVAMIIGTVIAAAVLMRAKRVPMGQLTNLLGGPLETAGVIILITSAGGAFGGMIKNSGIGDAVSYVSAGATLNLILLSWVVAAVIRIAQGSATVAMLTTAGTIEPLMRDALAAGSMGYNPVYLYMAIGYGAFGFSWMNDSGFWVVSRLSGLTEGQTLRSWTILQTIDSFAGLAITMVLAVLLPLPIHLTS